MSTPPRSERLAPVTRVAENREQQAARALGEARQELARRERQLQELQTYRHEYAEQFRERAGGGVAAAALRRFQAFLGQLDRAIGQQQQSVARASADCEQRRQAWALTRRRRQAVQLAVENCRADERRTAERREQRDTDEHAQRRGTASGEE